MCIYIYIYIYTPLNITNRCLARVRPGGHPHSRVWPIATCLGASRHAFPGDLYPQLFHARAD